MLKVMKYVLNTKKRSLGLKLEGFEYVKKEDFTYYGKKEDCMLIYAIFDEERLIAISSLFCFNKKERREVMLENCEVLPAYRGRGLQLHLLRARLNEVQSGEIVIVDCESQQSYKNVLKMKEERKDLMWKITPPDD